MAEIDELRRRTDKGLALSVEMARLLRHEQEARGLDAVDLDHRISNGDYNRKLEKLQRKLAQIQQAYLFSGRSGVIVFEGWDAAGKGGTIRRISAALDPRSFKVWPVGAPRLRRAATGGRALDSRLLRG